MSSENEASRLSGCSTLGGSTIVPFPDRRLTNWSPSSSFRALRAVVRLMPKRRVSRVSDGSASPAVNSPSEMADRRRSAI